MNYNLEKGSAIYLKPNNPGKVPFHKIEIIPIILSKGGRPYNSKWFSLLMLYARADQVQRVNKWVNFEWFLNTYTADRKKHRRTFNCTHNTLSQVSRLLLTHANLHINLCSFSSSQFGTLWNPFLYAFTVNFLSPNILITKTKGKHCKMSFLALRVVDEIVIVEFYSPLLTEIFQY